MKVPQKHSRKERDRQIYHRKRWSGLTHDEIMNDTVKYHREKFHEHVKDMIFMRKYWYRKLFLTIFVWTPLAIWIVPVVYEFKMTKSWMQLNAMVVMIEIILILMLIF